MDQGPWKNIDSIVSSFLSFWEMNISAISFKQIWKSNAEASSYEIQIGKVLHTL